VGKALTLEDLMILLHGFLGIKQLFLQGRKHMLALTHLLKKEEIELNKASTSFDKSLHAGAFGTSRAARFVR